MAAFQVPKRAREVLASMGSPPWIIMRYWEIVRLDREHEDLTF